MVLLKNQISLSQDDSSPWHSRGYLPHYEEAEHTQMVTYRLYDSLPHAALVKLAEELQHVESNNREPERRRRIEVLLDKGAGSCVLLNKSIAQTIEENLLYFDRKRYTAHAWAIMPNHVHILVTPNKGVPLSDIIHSWKSYTAHKANAILGKQKDFWQREYFDRMIRNEDHFRDAFSYIHNNPVKAGLCKTPTDWPYSSARLFLK